MSTATAKRSLDEALADAKAFRDMFTGAFERWEIAGSIRRKKPEVSDVDHAVIPKFGEQNTGGLFGETRTANLLWSRLDQLVTSGVVSKHYYGVNAPHRWGELLRGVDFHGAKHEIWTATEANWGSTLAIRTGPAELSQRLVTNIRKQGFRQKDGAVWSCDRCQCTRHDDCKACDGTGLVLREQVAVPTEEHFFRLCGMTYLEPETRR